MPSRTVSAGVAELVARPGLAPLRYGPGSTSDPRRKRTRMAMPTRTSATLVSCAMVNWPRKRSSFARKISMTKRSAPAQTRYAPKSHPVGRGSVRHFQRKKNATSMIAVSYSCVGCTAMTVVALTSGGTSMPRWRRLPAVDGG